MGKVKAALMSTQELVKGTKGVAEQIKAIRKNLNDQIDAILQWYGGYLDLTSDETENCIKSSGMVDLGIDEWSVIWIGGDKIDTQVDSFDRNKMNVDDLVEILDWLYDFAENDMGMLFPPTVREILTDGQVGEVDDSMVQRFIDERWFEVNHLSVEEVRKEFLNALL